MKKEDAKFQKHLSSSYECWRKFFKQIHQWMEEDGLEVDPVKSKDFDLEIHRKWMERYNLNKTATVKKHISSTHAWVKGKERWSKKYDNWFMNPIECKVCKMGASDYEEVGWALVDYAQINLEKGEVPSRDMHNHYIYRTCEEVQAARMAHRKSRKGRKCLQCGTYACIDNHD